MKRVLLALSTILMSCCVVADTWTDPKTGIVWTYTVTGDEASVGGGDMWNTAVPTSTTGAVAIPPILGECPVTGICGGAFSGCSNLTSLTIPESVTYIGWYAFCGCSGLTSVTIPSNVIDIAGYAFYGCGGLTSVTICEGVELIGDWAFYGCSNLTSVTIPASVKKVPGAAFWDCSGLTSVTFCEGVTSVGFAAFYGCSNLTSVTIPASVTSIGDFAFDLCTAMTSVTIPVGVTNIGGCAFAGCSGLTSVTIPASVRSIGDQAFRGCDALTSFEVHPNNLFYKSVDGCLLQTEDNVLVCAVNGDVTLPSIVKSIGDFAFEHCTAMTSVTIPMGVTNIGYRAFSDCSGLTSVTIPASVRSIGDWAFAECGGLTTVMIPDGVTSVGRGVFSRCKNMTSVTIPVGVTNIGYYAFAGCSGLMSVTIPASVRNIGDCAFEYCTAMTSVTIPEGVTSIGDWAFYYCDALDVVDFEGGPPAGLADARFNQDTTIRYNVAYEAEWLPVIEECGFTNAMAYDPFLAGEGTVAIAFVVPEGESSMSIADYPTNAIYGRLPEARREGFTFAGWYTSLDGTNRVSAFSAVDPKVKTLYARWVEDDVSLYAQWEANRYSVSFNANGGEGEMEAQPFLYDQVQSLSGAGFTKTGYTFKGWSTSADGEVVYTDGESVSNLTAEAGFAVALFAQWEKVIDVPPEEVEEWVGYTLAPKFKKAGETNSQYRKRFEATYGDDYSAAFFKETGKIGQDGTRLQVWHDYVAGTDPLDENDKFIATITIEDGVVKVEYSPKFADQAEIDKRVYKTWGKVNLNDKSWSEVSSGHEGCYKFFKVTVEMK